MAGEPQQGGGANDVVDGDAVNNTNTNTNGKPKFSIAALKLSETHDEVRSERQITTIPMRKPGQQDWAAVMREPECGFGPVATITTKDDGIMYVVAPHIVPSLERKEYAKVVLYPAITTSGHIFLWPVRVDRDDSWAQSSREAVELARQSWVRVVAQLGAGYYETHVPVGDLAPATWPKLSIDEMLEIALRHRLIDSLDHPVLRRLRGDF